MGILFRTRDGNSIATGKDVFAGTVEKLVGLITGKRQTLAKICMLQLMEP